MMWEKRVVLGDVLVAVLLLLMVVFLAGFYVFERGIWRIGTDIQDTIAGSYNEQETQQVRETQDEQRELSNYGTALSVPPRPVPPKLELYSPKEGDMVRVEGVQVSGITDPDARIRIEVIYDGDRDVEFPDATLIAPREEDGTFSHVVLVPHRPVRGINVIATRSGENTSKTINLFDSAAGVPTDPHKLLVNYFGYDYTIPPYRGEGVSDDGEHYKQTSTALKLLLNGINRKFPRYREHYFDCSNAAAMLWQMVKDSGFNAVIATGPTPWNPGGGRHAWVIVYCEDQAVAVESTVYTEGHPLFIDQFISIFTGSAPGVIKKLGTDRTRRYYEPDKMYYDIYSAVRTYGALGMAHEWDWWSKLQ